MSGAPNPSCNFRCSLEKSERHTLVCSVKSHPLLIALHNKCPATSSLQVSAAVNHLSEGVVQPLILLYQRRAELQGIVAENLAQLTEFSACSSPLSQAEQTLNSFLCALGLLSGRICEGCWHV